MTGAEVRSNIFFIILKASKKNLNILKFHFPSEGAGEPKSGPEIAPQKADIFRKSHLSDTRHPIPWLIILRNMNSKMKQNIPNCWNILKGVTVPLIRNRQIILTCLS